MGSHVIFIILSTRTGPLLKPGIIKKQWFNGFPDQQRWFLNIIPQISANLFIYIQPLHNFVIYSNKYSFVIISLIYANFECFQCSVGQFLLKNSRNNYNIITYYNLLLINYYLFELNRKSKVSLHAFIELFTPPCDRKSN